ncbi:hypothetical protein SAMN05421852_102255 [Thermoflavimicrobium dichotomicum]|uniref:Uncharacterized protein n=1 Tax=Thermoflavimicrobium dichotomicum TaxID=46223 RepID=A0A1I3LMT3_9BACL|nr:hypothetical protein SAMN05421852_102255 [Thermoflavimicrobium dichotomicum]
MTRAKGKLRSERDDGGAFFWLRMQLDQRQH